MCFMRYWQKMWDKIQAEGQSTIRRLLFLYGWRIKEGTDGAGIAGNW